MADIVWDEERISILTKLWAQGISAGNIAVKFSATRSAIIGKIHRLGLPTPNAKQKRIRTERDPQKRIVRHNTHFVEASAASVALPVLSMPNGHNISTAQRCTLLQLTSGVCKWPFGEPQTPNFFFCGGVAVDGKSYCVEHCRVAYRA